MLIDLKNHIPVKSLNLSPFLKDLVLTTATSGVIGFSLIIVTRLLAQGFGPEEFGVYSLSRRVFSTAIPFSTLAMGVTIARYTAISQDEGSRFRFLLGGLILGVAPSLALLLIGITFIKPLSVLIFHSLKYTLVLIATLLMLVGYSFYHILYAFYRGMGQMRKANIWQLIVIALGPIVIASIYAKPGYIPWVLLTMGGLYLTAAVPLGRYILKGREYCNKALHIMSTLKELFHYGFPRVPGSFAFAGMSAIGPFLALYFGSLKDAGYLVAAQSVFVLAETGLVAFGLLILPKAAQLFAEGHTTFLQERICDITALVIHCGSFIAIHLFLWADQLILVWLGPSYMGVIPLMRILILALIPYLLYAMLRSIVDAIEERAVNTYNLCISLFATATFSVLLAMAGLGIRGLAVGTAVGFVVLGVATVQYLWRTHWIATAEFHLRECLWLNVGVLGIAFGFRYMIVSAYPPVIVLSLALLLEGFLFSLYCFMLRKFQPEWMIQLEQQVIKGNEQ